MANNTIECCFRQPGDSEKRRAASNVGRLLKLVQEYKDACPAETADFDAAVESLLEPASAF